MDEYRALEPDAGAARRLVGAHRALARAAPAALRRLRRTREIKPQFLVEALYEATDSGDCILSSDVGQHQMWAAQYFHFAEPRRWINSGGLGTMGFGLPAAIGAAVGVPGHPERAADRRRLVPDEHPGARDRAPVRHPGQVRDHGQRLPGHGPPVAGAVLGPALLQRRHGPRWPDWVKLADAYGATGVLLTDKTTLVDDLRAALATPGPVVVDVKVTREENTYPMIAPGAAAREMVG